MLYNEGREKKRGAGSEKRFVANQNLGRNWGAEA